MKMIIALLALVAIADPAETLPIDRSMAAFEAADPELRQFLARAGEQIWRLGPREPDWATTGLAAATALAATGNEADHVLGEWKEGGHGVAIPSDRPLTVPPGWQPYSVRGHDGPVDYHYYHRLMPGIVVHRFAATTRIGNADCYREAGMEVIARQPWQSWSEDRALVVFATLRAFRDDVRTYCTMYRPTPDGRFGQLSYTIDGQPYVLANEDPQAFTVTGRAEATTRIFSDDPPAHTAE